MLVPTIVCGPHQHPMLASAAAWVLCFKVTSQSRASLQWGLQRKRTPAHFSCKDCSLLSATSFSYHLYSKSHHQYPALLSLWSCLCIFNTSISLAVGWVAFLPGFFAFIIQSTDMLWILISQNNSVYCWIFLTGENVTLLCVRDFCFTPCCVFMFMHVSTNVPFLHATLVSGICMHIEALCTDISLFASIPIQKLGSWKVMANMACYLGVLHIFMYFLCMDLLEVCSCQWMKAQFAVQFLHI